jgi:hypothetical protein
MLRKCFPSEWKPAFESWGECLERAMNDIVTYMEHVLKQATFARWVQEFLTFCGTLKFIIIFIIDNTPRN